MPGRWIQLVEVLMSTWEMVGSVALAIIVIGVLVNIPDIVRYIRISTM